MLFKVKHLQGIKEGHISLAFRKWKKARVKKGSLLKTAIGQVEVVNISVIEKGQINEKDAKAAGYEKQEDLLKLLNIEKEGTLYKIQVKYHSPDPRIQLREETNLTEEEFKQIRSKLERLDKYSKIGEWTISILQAIHHNPGLRAADLAEKTGKEKDWLKPNIRKLKNLGLTISLDVGYRLSPRGKLILDKLIELK